jgi:two-component system, LytTR family, response regulator AlgR
MLRVLIIDDEALARLRLRSLMAEMQGVSVAGEAGDADEALALLARTPVDVVLLDIRLPGRDGLRLAQALKALPTPPAVVFVTAHTEHALEAFELQALDYLTKPVRRDRLHAALQRVQPARPAAAEGDTPMLVVSDRGRLLRLPVADVLVLKAELKYVTLRTATRSYVLDDALADLEQRLGERFVRIHRNALVARQAIRELALRGTAHADGTGDGWAVRLSPLDEWLAVSRRQVAGVRAALAGDAA